MKAILEGLLFVSGDEGLTEKQIIDTLDINKEKAQDLINSLASDYENIERGITIKKLGNKYKLTTKPSHAPYYKKLFDDNTYTPLNESALETLAIIAYNQPVTRIMVDEIRGVNSAHIIRKLVFRNLIKEVGRSDLPGRPILYGVTEEFLDYFGLESTSELPAINKEIEEKETNLFEKKYTD